jgi:oligo-1,6-glucosidase
MKRAFSSWQYKLEGKAWNMLYIENHDHPRIISRYGSEKYRTESGKALAVSYLFQKGTPFLYQGQEIGMLNWRPEDAEMYEDVQTRYYYQHSNLKKSPEKRLHKLWRSSRDSARTPVQWTGGENAGFTTGTPWFYINENYKDINVEREESYQSSLLNFYREAIALRKGSHAVRHGSYKEYFKGSSKLYVYERESSEEKLLIVASFSEKPTKMRAPKSFDISSAEIILASHKGNASSVLKPYESRVYRIKKN